MIKEIIKETVTSNDNDVAIFELKLFGNSPIWWNNSTSVTYQVGFVETVPLLVCEVMQLKKGVSFLKKPLNLNSNYKFWKTVKFKNKIKVKIQKSNFSRKKLFKFIAKNSNFLKIRYKTHLRISDYQKSSISYKIAICSQTFHVD